MAERDTTPGKTAVAVFAEGSFEDFCWFADETFIDGFIEGVSEGASHYGSGSCFAVRWPLTAYTESQVLVSGVERDEIARADREFKKERRSHG